MRHLKTIGLMALMALAGSALFAASAQAQAGKLTTGTTPETHKAADITAEQYPDPWVANEEWNFFSVTPGAVSDEEKVRCDTAILSGTTTTGIVEKELTVTANYIHCSAGKQPATVTMNGCDYILTQPSTDASKEYTGKVDLTCPKEKRIQVHVYLFGNATSTSHSFNVCTIEIWPNAEAVGEHKTQELGGHVIYKNVPESKPDDITAKVTAEGITVTDGCHEDKHHTNGIYKQTLTIKAYKHNSEHIAGNQLDAWMSE